MSGALCPPVNLVLGGCADIIGGALRRVPVWEIAFAFNASRACGSPFLLFLNWETVMTPRKQKNLRQPLSPEPLQMTNAHAAGIDIHAAIHWVAVPPKRHRPRRPTIRPTCRLMSVPSALAPKTSLAWPIG